MQARFQIGHLQIENPLRLSDLVNSQDAALARFEELIARDKLELSRVKALTDGFMIRPRLSPPFTEWATALRRARHLWLDSSELDPFATTVLFSHTFRSDSDANPFHKPLDSPFGAYTALCLWHTVGEAAAYLRREVLGPRLLAAYGAADLFTITRAQLIKDLALSEGSLNSIVLPHYCQPEWEGILLRIDRPNVARVVEYFIAEEPADVDVPTVVTLGGFIDTVYAAGPSEVRIAICPEHCTPQAIDSLSHWLRGFEPRVKADRNLLLT